MDKIKNMSLLSQMQSVAALLLQRIEQLENEGGDVHAIDVDLLRDKTRSLYDLMLRLQNSGIPESGNSKGAVEPTTIYSSYPLDVPLEVESARTKKEFNEHHINEIQIEAETLEEPSIELFEDPLKMPDAIEEESSAVFNENFVEQSPDEKSNTVFQSNPASFQHKKESAGSTLDLFGDNPAIADKLQMPDNSLAGKMQRSRIQDIREAIGINDKFLMINELFEGNITSYNRAIDELNDFQSYNGAKTYLIELSVQYQWYIDSPAVERIHQLIERKFGHDA